MGWAWLLPHLIGPQRALDVIITNSMNQNKQLRPAQAAELGVVDVVFEPPTSSSSRSRGPMTSSPVGHALNGPLRTPSRGIRSSRATGLVSTHASTGQPQLVPCPGS